MRYRFVLLVVSVALGLVALPGEVRADVAGEYELAESRYKSGRYEEAVDRFREYVEINPYNPEVYLLAGEAHYLAGRPREALLAWETSLKLNPGDLELAGKIENLKRK